MIRKSSKYFVANKSFTHVVSNNKKIANVPIYNTHSQMLTDIMIIMIYCGFIINCWIPIFDDFLGTCEPPI